MSTRRIQYYEARTQLYKLSKTELIKKCKLYNVQTTGSETDMIDSLLKNTSFMKSHKAKTKKRKTKNKADKKRRKKSPSNVAKNSPLNIKSSEHTNINKDSTLLPSKTLKLKKTMSKRNALTEEKSANTHIRKEVKRSSIKKAKLTQRSPTVSRHEARFEDFKSESTNDSMDNDHFLSPSQTQIQHPSQAIVFENDQKLSNDGYLNTDHHLSTSQKIQATSSKIITSKSSSIKPVIDVTKSSPEKDLITMQIQPAKSRTIRRDPYKFCYCQKALTRNWNNKTKHCKCCLKLMKKDATIYICTNPNCYYKMITSDAFEICAKCHEFDYSTGHGDDKQCSFLYQKSEDVFARIS